jgi:hypothetical protein
MMRVFNALNLLEFISVKDVSLDFGRRMSQEDRVCGEKAHTNYCGTDEQYCFPHDCSPVLRPK